ncbi:ATPase [Cafeteriavirus-dependent mavirus]|uniref:Putative FtsK-HerA family ATPase n=2 Tax=Cafeteriavirus-dependent mavirus TaxID=1932923 RepID=F1DAT6_9VIRU|nr:putative FtsK-HerA family ATPase [Maverick-related virus strain Spezl]API81732.1 putative FtsK-HerA family ATPase [Cafeteriavirus-dependent mavirus]ADZ16414.1 putative FtsK-HerA family ATPase [Maverick-related virus strain Spezl]CAI9421288.1 ATPase [Cafeteriavirus-dependent mavirus]CAI9421307.1 ATPase [Cafeteriavirus-dependent mavirus]CAI9421338.1 ATPase [Cafeteriavirus-dependent mavirus]
MSINELKKGYPIAENKTLGRYSKSKLIYFDPSYEMDDDEGTDYFHTNGKDLLEVIPPSIQDKEIDSDRYFISGQSGSGKSTFVVQLIDKYTRAGIKHFFAITDKPDRRFGKIKYLDINDFVIPYENEDEEEKIKLYEKEKIKFKHLKKFLEPEEVLKEELRINDLKVKKGPKKTGYQLRFSNEDIGEIFKDSVIFFDDYEKNKDVKLIEVLRDHLLTQGRHYKCNMIIANHKTQGGPSFGLIKQETTNYVIFKKSTSYQREGLFKNYLGLKKRQRDLVDKLLLKSRWVCYNIDNHLTISQKAVVNTDTIK